MCFNFYRHSIELVQQLDAFMCGLGRVRNKGVLLAKVVRSVQHPHRPSKKSAIGYVWGWPESYIYTVYDRIFGDFPAKIPYEHRIYIYMVLANPSYVFGGPEPYLLNRIKFLGNDYHATGQITQKKSDRAGGSGT